MSDSAVASLPQTPVIPKPWTALPLAPEDRLSDEEVLDFIVRGYHIILPTQRPGLNEEIDDILNHMKRNPGNEIYEEVPLLHEIYNHPKVRGTLASLLGNDVEMSGHRHWHTRAPGPWSQGWHQDGNNVRHKQIRVVLGMYYPHDVTIDMGPTVIVPGTHFRNAPTDRMATYGNIRGQVPIVVKAGSIAVTHYDIWHGGSINRSNRYRHMLKFLFSRKSEPNGPSWNHDPEIAAQIANQKLTFDTAVACGQSDSYKERQLRMAMWKFMLGGQTVKHVSASFASDKLATAKGPAKTLY